MWSQGKKPNLKYKLPVEFIMDPFKGDDLWAYDLNMKSIVAPSKNPLCW